MKDSDNDLLSFCFYIPLTHINVYQYHQTLGKQRELLYTLEQKMSVLYLIFQDKTYILSRHMGMQYAESIFEKKYSLDSKSNQNECYVSIRNPIKWMTA